MNTASFGYCNAGASLFIRSAIKRLTLSKHCDFNLQIYRNFGCEENFLRSIQAFEIIKFRKKVPSLSHPLHDVKKTFKTVTQACQSIDLALENEPKWIDVRFFLT